MTITQADVITILKTGIYPTTQTALSYYEQKQKFPIYPYVEVRKVQSDSNVTDVQKTSIEQTIEVRLYLKYTRPEGVEESDRIDTENEMLRVLELADMEPVGIIYFESKSWNTSYIDDAIRGSKSVLRFTIKDVDSTTGSGIIGSGDKIELDSETTPVQIQILSISTKKGFTIDQHTTDDRIVKYDPERLVKFGEFTITYETTTTLDTLLDGLSEAGESNNGKLIRGGVTTNYSFYVGQAVKSGEFGGIEKGTRTFYAESNWV